MAVLWPMALYGGVTGCSHQHASETETREIENIVVVVAPVLNLSNSIEWDPDHVTDIVASEFQSFPNIAVVPVNRTLAVLALRGKRIVESPEDALELARELGADATIVAAITEYDPYDPPRVGVVMQWYGVTKRAGGRPFDAQAASRQTTEFAPTGADAQLASSPLIQFQRIYDATDKKVIGEVRRYARQRSEHGSPYGWRVHIKSQELFVRYCMWSAIKSMLWAREAPEPQEANEAETWKSSEDA